MKVSLTQGFILRDGMQAKSDVTSCPLRERSKYNSRTADAGTLEPSIPLQSSIQLSGCGILVGRLTFSRLQMLRTFQVHCRGPNERGRPAISYLEEDVYRRRSAVLDG
jgi:hypothetical protein